MTTYDEDLKDNPFHRELLKSHSDLLERASREKWIICVPRKAAIRGPVTFVQIAEHILIPDDQTKTYSTLNKTPLRLSNECIGVVKPGRKEPAVTRRILFKETFYVKGLKYHVYCLDGCLDECGDGANFTNVSCLRDCIEFLKYETEGNEILVRINDACEEFLLNRNDLNDCGLQDLEQYSHDLFVKSFRLTLKYNGLDVRIKRDRSAAGNLRAAVEAYAQSCLNGQVFNVVCACVLESDARVNKSLRNLQHAYFDVERCANFHEAKHELGKINRSVTTLGKFNCIKSAFGVLSRKLTAEDLIEIFAFLIIHSQVNNWTANLVYMQRFNFSQAESERFDQRSFLLTTFEAALEYVKSGILSESAKLNESDSEFIQLICSGDLDKIKQLLNTEDSYDVQERKYLWLNNNSNSNGNTDSYSKSEVRETYTNNGNSKNDCDKLHVTDDKYSIDDSDCSDTSKKYYTCLSFNDSLQNPNDADVVDGTINDSVQSFGSINPSDVVNSSVNECEDTSRSKHDNSKLKNVSRSETQCHPLCSCDDCLKLNSSTFSPDYRDEKGRNGLHIACYYGYPHIVDYFIQKGADVNALDYLNTAPVHHAAARGHQNALLLLLHSGADLNVVDGNGNSALHLSSANGHESCVKALLYYSEHVGEKPAVDSRNVNGDTALHLAVYWGYVRIIKILLQYGASVNVRNRKDKRVVDTSSNFRVKKLLLGRIAHPEKLVPQNTQPRMKTPNSEQLKRTELLLKAIEDNDLPLTCFYLGIIVPVLQKQKSVNEHHPLCDCDECCFVEKDDDYNEISTKTHFNNQRLRNGTRNENVRLSQTNLDNGDNVSKNENNYKTEEIRSNSEDRKATEEITRKSLDSADNERLNGEHNNEHPITVKQPVKNPRLKARHYIDVNLNESKPREHKLNVNTAHKNGYSALHVAAKHGRTEILRLLLDKGADVNARAENTLYTPLHLACINQRLGVVRELLQCGSCELDARDFKGNTAAHYACFKNDLKVLEVLLVNGCDAVGARNADGKSVLQQAEDMALTDAVRLIKEKCVVSCVLDDDDGFLLC